MIMELERPEAMGDALTDWDRTRVALSYAAMQLSDLSREIADTQGDGVAQPGSFARDAARIRSWAELLERYGVLLERLRGTSWAVIAESAGGRSRQAAHERWGRDEEAWRTVLSGDPADMPVGARNPEKIVAELEEWAHRRGSARVGQIMAGLDGVRARRARELEAPLRVALGDLLESAGVAAVGFAGLRLARRTLENSEASALDLLDAALAALASLAPSLKDGSAPPSIARAAGDLSSTLGVHPDDARKLGAHHSAT
jgi:hypothetical protein